MLTQIIASRRTPIVTDFPAASPRMARAHLRAQQAGRTAVQGWYGEAAVPDEPRSLPGLADVLAAFTGTPAQQTRAAR